MSQPPRRPRELLLRLLPFLGVLTLWEAASRLGHWPRYLLPGPEEVASALVRLVARGDFAVALARSLSRLGRGFAFSFLVGVPLGILLARSTAWRAALKPWVMGLQALPSICWLPLALLWFGLTDLAISFVVVMGSLLAVAIASEDAVRAIHPLYYQVAGSLGVRGPRLWLGVLLPAALPGIMTGAKLGWSFAWRALLAGELLFVSGGLGQLLTIGRELFDTAHVIAVMLGIVATGTAIDRLFFQALEVRIRRRWGLLVQA